jgi:NTP pyrophosphatase (non-canonical NTP hydrolase)
MKEFTDALNSVLDERKRQDEKWGEQNHNPYIYLTILLEEIGELAQAILHTQFGGEKGGWLNVRKEAVHSAAVALALIECLDRNKWTAGAICFENPNGNRP